MKERKVLSPDFKESEDAESFERDYQVCLLAMSSMWEWKVFFFQWYVDKRKQNGKQFTERNVIIINFVLTYLLPIESFCDILCDIYF